MVVLWFFMNAFLWWWLEEWGFWDRAFHPYATCHLPFKLPSSIQNMRIDSIGVQCNMNTFWRGMTRTRVKNSVYPTNSHQCNNAHHFIADKKDTPVPLFKAKTNPFSSFPTKPGWREYPIHTPNLSPYLPKPTITSIATFVTRPGRNSAQKCH